MLKYRLFFNIPNLLALFFNKTAYEAFRQEMRNVAKENGIPFLTIIHRDYS